MASSGIHILVTLCVVAIIFISVESSVLTELNGKLDGAQRIYPVALQAKEETQEKGPPNCKKLMLVVAKRMLKVFNGCIKNLKEMYKTKEEVAEHFQCAIKCFMGLTKMAKEDGTITNATMAVFADEQLPPEYHPLYYKLTGQCLIEWGPKIDPSDPKCTAYGDMIKCMQEVSTTAC